MNYGHGFILCVCRLVLCFAVKCNVLGSVVSPDTAYRKRPWIYKPRCVRPSFLQFHLITICLWTAVHHPFAHPSVARPRPTGVSKPSCLSTATSILSSTPAGLPSSPVPRAASEEPPRSNSQGAQPSLFSPLREPRQRVSSIFAMRADSISLGADRPRIMCFPAPHLGRA